MKKDAIVVMIHTGSVSIGYPTAVAFQKLLQEMYPKGPKKPDNGIYLLPVGEKYEQCTKDIFTGLYNAANFAFANRLFL